MSIQIKDIQRIPTAADNLLTVRVNLKISKLQSRFMVENHISPTKLLQAAFNEVMPKMEDKSKG